MANIELKGNTYLNVPYVDLPTTLQTTARFWENPLKMGVLRNDAQVVKTWSNDSMFVTDDQGTIPSYSTSAQTIVAAADLSTTYTMDLSNYDYFILYRALTIPVYNTATPAKGRNEYAILTAGFEVVNFPGSTFTSLVGNKTYASNNVTLSGSYTSYRLLYWSTASAVKATGSTTYGIQQFIPAPSISGSTLTVQNPSLMMRGSSTYLPSSVWSTITDIRRQFVIELYRVPKGSLNLNGWGLIQQGNHILDCVYNNNKKLT